MLFTESNIEGRSITLVSLFHTDLIFSLNKILMKPWKSHGDNKKLIKIIREFESRLWCLNITSQRHKIWKKNVCVKTNPKS